MKFGDQIVEISVLTRLREGDLTSLHNLTRQISEGTNPTTEETLKRFLQSPLSRAFVARHLLDGQIVAMGCILTKHRTNGTIVYIDNFVTDKDWRCRGIGSKIMECLLKEAKMIGAYRVDLGTCNPVAERFYRKHGFVFIEGEHVYWLRL